MTPFLCIGRALFFFFFLSYVPSVAGRAEDLPVRKPVATIGGGIGALCLEDEDRLWASVGTDLVLFDVSNPFDISIVSKLHLGGGLKQTIKTGEILYAIGKAKNSWVIDIENPQEPKIINELTFERDSPGFSKAGDLGFFADRGKVKVFDFSIPGKPEPILEFELGFIPMMMHIEGNLGFASIFREGIRVYDLSDPKAPEEVGNFPLQRKLTGLATQGATGFLGEAQMGIHSVDFSNPEEPKRIGYLENQNVSAPLHLADNYLFLPGTQPDLTVYDVSDPKSLVKIAEIDSLGAAEEVYYADERIFLPSEGLKVYDFSNPEEPQLLGKFSHPHVPKNVYCWSNIAYVGGDSSEVAVIDCSDPANPLVKSFLPLEGVPQVLSGKDRFLYACSKEAGLEVFDTSDPLKPERVFQDGRYQKVFRIEVKNNIAAALETSRSVHFLDVSVPSQPSWIASYNAGSSPLRGAVWVEDVLLIAATRGGVQLVDCTFPFSPVFKSLIGLQEPASGVALVGSTAILTAQQTPALRLDVSDPLHARKISEFKETPSSVISWKDRIFFNGNGGGQEYDLSDPENPLLVGRFRDGLGSYAVVFDDLLFDPSRWTGIRIYDLTNKN